MSSSRQESNPRQDSEPTGLSKGAQIAVGALVVAALLSWYGYTNLAEGGTFTYYQTLREFRAAGLPSPDQGLRIHGYVSTGSIERNLDARQVRFSVQNDPPHAAAKDAPNTQDARLSVVYQSLETPDLFKDGAEVVVEGHVVGQDGKTIFMADNVMAKCPSKFQAKAAGEDPPDLRAEAL